MSFNALPHRLVIRIQYKYNIYNLLKFSDRIISNSKIFSNFEENG